MFKELILADFRERTRRYSFLITLGFVLYFAYLVITGRYALTLGDCRSVYNAAWTGSLMGTGSTLMLLMFGFYLVNNCIRRDRETGVGEILTTTALSRTRYMLAKFVSNILTLSALVAILMPAGLLMQVLFGVTTHFSLWAFLSPFLFLTLPIIVLISALALLFESVRFLRSTAGNVLYFFIFQAMLVTSLESHKPVFDFIGASSMIPHMQACARLAFPSARIGMTMGFVSSADPETLLTFVWDGYPWPLEFIQSRLMMLLVSILLVLGAAFFFRGFATQREKPKSGRSGNTSSVGASRMSGTGLGSYRSLEPVRQVFSLSALLRAELLVMLKGLNRFWYLVAGVLVSLQFFLPRDLVFAIILPGSWIWPLIVWSSMGTRDHRFHTSDLFLCSPHPLRRQLPAAWLSGVLLTLVMASGILLRTLVAGELMLLSALLLSALFIPSMALFLGKMSGTRKPFEIGFMLLWYIGPIEKMPLLNFMATDGHIAHPFSPVLFMALAVALLAVLPHVSRRIMMH